MLLQYLRAKGHRTRGFAAAGELLETLDWSSGIDCILSDVRMPGMDGLALLDELKKRRVDAPVVLITGHGDVPLAVTAIKSGAFDLVEKPLSPEALDKAIDSALASRHRSRRAGAARETARAQLEALTPRQRQVLDLVAQGLSSKDIAIALEMSPRTVETHRAAIMLRVNANSLADLIRLKLNASS